MIEREFEGLNNFALGKYYLDTTATIQGIDTWHVYRARDPRFISVTMDINPELFEALSEDEHRERMRQAQKENFIIDSGGFPV